MPVFANHRVPEREKITSSSQLYQFSDHALESNSGLLGRKLLIIPLGQCLFGFIHSTQLTSNPNFLILPEIWSNSKMQKKTSPGNEAAINRRPPKNVTKIWGEKFLPKHFSVDEKIRFCCQSVVPGDRGGKIIMRDAVAAWLSCWRRQHINYSTALLTEKE